MLIITILEKRLLEVRLIVPITNNTLKVSKGLQVLSQESFLEVSSWEQLNTLFSLIKDTIDISSVVFFLQNKNQQWFIHKTGQAIFLEESGDEDLLDIVNEINEVLTIDDMHQINFSNNVQKTHLAISALNNTNYPIQFFSYMPICVSSNYLKAGCCLINNSAKNLSSHAISLLAKLKKLVELELSSLATSLDLTSPTASEVNRSILKAHHVFLNTDNERLTFNILLDELLALTQTSFAYIGELKNRIEDGVNKPYLRMKSISNIAWNKETRKLYEEHKKTALEFRNLDNLLGVSLRSGNALIVNDFVNDCRIKGLPIGHPGIDNYCAIPILSGNDVIGQIGLANRQGGFSDSFIQAIEAITYTVGVLIERARLIQESENYTRKLDEAAHLDETSGLPNRRSLSKFLDTIISNCTENESFVVCFLDLDGFKLINDSYGHQQGDELLALVAKRLQQMVRKEDFVARISGDEFVVVLRETNQGIYQRILEAISQPFQLEVGSISISASMGLAKFPDDGTDRDQLLRFSDQAMYLAKHSGKNQVLQFDANMHKEQQRKTKVMEEVLCALKNDEFEAYLQAKFVVKNKTILGFELLSRWQHKEKGLLLPAEFLPDICDTHVQIAFDNSVFERVPNIIKALHALNKQFTLNVNVSPEYFNSQFFIKSIENLAKNYPNKVPFIVLEIVESTALGDLDKAVERLKYCNKLGFHISLDDFGTSFSSLTYFRRLPANEVKIDKSFINDILTNEQDLAIVKAIVSMAKAFSRTIVAEGVESDTQLSLLEKLGCETAQGNVFSPAMSLTDAIKFVKQQAK